MHVLRHHGVRGLAVLLAAACVTAPDLAAEQTNEAAFTWGILGPRRAVVTDDANVYFINSRNELRVRAKADLLPPESQPPAKDAPSPPGTLRLGGIAEDLALLGPGRLLAATGLHVELVDVRDRTSPKRSWRMRIADREEDGAARLLVKDDRVFLAARKQGLLELRKKSSLRNRVGRLSLPGFASDVCVLDEDTLAVAVETGVALVQVSERMRQTSYFDVPHSAWSVAASGARLYVAGKEHVSLYDLSDRKKPKHLALGAGRDPFYFSAHYELLVHDGLLFAARSEGGLYIYAHESESDTLAVQAQYSHWATKRVPTRAEKESYLADFGLDATSPGAQAFLAHPGYHYLIALGLHVEANRIYLTTHNGRVAVLERDATSDGRTRALRVVGFYD